MADLNKFSTPKYLFRRYVFDWKRDKRIKTNARGNVELYLGHVNTRENVGIQIRTGGKTCIVQISVQESVSVSVGGNKPL